MGELVELLGQGLLAIISGGATGILGVIFQRLFDHWKNKQELDKLKAQHEHEREMKRIDIEMMKEEWAQRVKVAQVEGETAREVADAQAFAASFGTEPKLYSQGQKVGEVGAFFLALADFCRGIVRPGLTIYLAWVATEIYIDSKISLALIQATAELGGLGPQDMKALVDLHAQIVFTLLYLFTTCVLWWFGTRNKGPQPKLG